MTWEDLLEKEMATHSSILAWEIPWTEEPTERGVWWAIYSSWGHKSMGHDLANRQQLCARHSSKLFVCINPMILPITLSGRY